VFSLLTILDWRAESWERTSASNPGEKNRSKMDGEFLTKKGGTNGFLFVPGGQ
jgi:hypothetical protein